MIIRKTLREQVVEILRHKILSGEIKPGERIIEAKVAEELKVSRGPLREALRQIEEEGLVVYEAQKGCVVKTMTYEEMQETYLIQSTLEKLAVQMCGGEISKEQDEEMQKLVLSMEKAANQKNLYEVIKFDEQFHECIVKTAHSEKLHRIWKILEGGNTAAYYTMDTKTLVPFDVVHINHQRILDLFHKGTVEDICKEIEFHYMVVPHVLYENQKKKGEKEWNESDDFKRVGTEGLSGEDIGEKSLTYWADVWRRFRENKLAIFGLILLGLIVVLLFIGPMVTGQDYQLIDASIKNQGPSSAHWFGTDDMGRDLFTRVCVGGRISIYIGLCCTLVMFVIGALLGALAGLKGGLVDDIIMRICEFIGNLPYLIIVVILSMVLGRSMFSLVFAMSLTAWVGTARMVRGQILQIKEQDYVQAATALGASTGRIIVKHLLPNTLGIIMVDITMSVPGFIFSEAFLSYIGLGVRPPETSWGALASAGQQQLMFYPHELFFPCLMIVLTMLTFHLIGDGLSDALDPKLRK